MPLDMVIVVFCCKFCEVPSRVCEVPKDLTIAERIVVLRKIREQPPNISHRQLAEITGVPRTTLARILQDFGQLGHPLNRAKWCSSRCDPIKRNLL